MTIGKLQEISPEVSHSSLVFSVVDYLPETGFQMRVSPSFPKSMDSAFLVSFSTIHLFNHSLIPVRVILIRQVPIELGLYFYNYRYPSYICHPHQRCPPT